MHSQRRARPRRRTARPVSTLPRPSRLDAPISSLKGAGPKLAAAASEIGIETLGDLLWHLPRRYLDASTITPLADARVGEERSCLGRVVAKRVMPTRRGRISA